MAIVLSLLAGAVVGVVTRDAVVGAVVAVCVAATWKGR